MIWYRHWVEMRLGVLMFAGLCIWSGVSVRGPWHSLEYGLALPLTPLGQAIGADGVLVWAEFAGRILPFSLAASFALAGAGFRTFFMPVAPVVYTLTLPISRTRLIWTRLAAGLGVACVGAAVLTAGGVVWFTMRGQTVPMAEVLQSLALGVVLLAAMLAIMSAVVTALPTARRPVSGVPARALGPDRCPAAGHRRLAGDGGGARAGEGLLGASPARVTSSNNQLLSDRP